MRASTAAVIVRWSVDRIGARPKCAATKHGGLCRTADSATTIKSRGQVAARQAERQRRFITGLKTGEGALRIPLSVQELPPPRPRLRSKATHRAIEGASRLGVLRGERIGAVPPAGG